VAVPSDLRALRADRGDAALLVWGGASQVGSMAVQMGAALGFTVYATASPGQHAYVKSLGAAEVFDYKSASVVDDIVAAVKKAGKKITQGIDAITTAKTVKPSSDVLAAFGGGKLVITLGYPEGLEQVKSVEATTVWSGLKWASRGDVAVWFYHEFLPTVLETGAVVPSPKVQIVEGGMKSLQEAVNIVKSGTNSKKVVVKVE
jgi:NADPH:quinone reductase-like Zn-dependent oxidoreductase